ncbi:MAG: hypothetical protein F6J90_07320 [Moorea sp. SIOASIH]|uniref:SGNH hydrolase domain-containing protein n=1 Tax=Moorena sp. SIOASIH TaxID=2607817 RepID=UPI0013BDC259|nr:SGNH hydrolase domain-containing protein [Moorena sp. SIOASIH]NEO36143.1 hypothetical protein [Moorena sp. SIOASIH]
MAKAYAKENWWPTPDQAAISKSSISDDNCMNGLDISDHVVTREQFETCTIPPTTQDNLHIFMIGDSHAFALVPMLGQVHNETGIGVTTVSSSACPVSLNILRNRIEGGLYTACQDYVKSMLELVQATAKPGDIVLIASRYRTYLSSIPPISWIDTESYHRGQYDLFRDGKLISKADAQRQVATDLIEIGNQLAAKGVTLVLHAPLPEHHIRAEQCLPVWFSAGGGLKPECTVSREENLAHRQPAMDVLQTVEQALTNVYVWDVFDQLCPGEKCSHFRDGKPLFRDDDHLALYGSRSLVPDFIVFLQQHDLLEDGNV